MSQPIPLAVRQLVEFVLQSGDISTSGYVSASRALAGTRGHQRVQKSRPANYEPEVSFRYEHTVGAQTFLLQGRIDGVWREDDGPVVDEIKTTSRPAEAVTDENELHWAQAKVYAHVLADTEGHAHVGVQLTYLSLDDETTREFRRSFSALELGEFFRHLIADYAQWAARLTSWREKRDAAIHAAGFPFDDYRAGQRELAVAAWRTFEGKSRLFALAPTGIGKTAAVLFPALKALAHGHAEKAFYLTAKTTGRATAEDTLRLMRRRGVACRSITLTAKDKICFEPDAECDGESCPYALGYYDRIRGALIDALKHQDIGRERVEMLAKRHKVCPFELSLDISLYADCVICDYNYAFDPRVFLRRFFMESSLPWMFLVDEAHNLVDRGREMYSATLCKKDALRLRREVKEDVPALNKKLGEINHELLEWRKQCEEEGGAVVRQELPEVLLKSLRSFARAADGWLAMNIPALWRADMLDFYFAAQHMIRIAEFYGDDYVTWAQKRGDDLEMKLYCLDPARLLNAAFERAASAVVFSATLHPLDFYRELLGGRSDDGMIELGSPFPHENLALAVHYGILTTYRERASSYNETARVIEAAATAAGGNTFVYFPSYKYMEAVAALVAMPDVELLVQRRGMSEQEREAWLERFSVDNPTPVLGMGVMGGVFAEGVDLVGERLVCAVIVGVGLPMVCLERELLRNYYQEREGTGFAYAYMLPGFNRVMQAAGRVIRSDTDRGAVVLVDQRFARHDYQELFPAHWNHAVFEKDTREVERVLQGFWEKIGD